VDSGESFTTTQLDELNINQLYNQYRVKYKLPFTDEIKLIREKYGLSASKMSEVLGFGANVYRNYEAGEVPNQSNARLIQLAGDAREFKKLVELSSAFEGNAQVKIFNKIESILQNQEQSKSKIDFENYLLGSRIPNSNTGYRLPNLEKFTQMVLFFTEKMQPWKTKLNKLLFYSDFSMYCKTGLSISGLQYRAIPMGPIPNNFQSIFEYLVNNNNVDIHYTTFPDGNTGEQFMPLSRGLINLDIFTEHELSVLEEIAARFKSTSTSDIINISHKEKAWIENEKERKIIDYTYGFDLN
jgi:transcriptional regulator with XRE-family HTH domain